MCKLQIVFLGLLVKKEELFLKSKKAIQTFNKKNIMLCYNTEGPLEFLG